MAWDATRKTHPQWGRDDLWRYVAELRKGLEALGACYVLLRKLEWSVPDYDYPEINRCPECGMMEPHGHGDTTGPCALDALLNPAGGTN